MIGASRESYQRLKGLVDSKRGDAQLDTLAGDLMAAADVISSDLGLRSLLADGGQPADTRAGVVASIFGARLRGLPVHILSELVRARWSSPADMVAALDGLAAQAGFLQAEVAGRLDRVADELFDFGQLVAGSADLQMALTNPAVGEAEKSALVRSLLDGRSDPITAELLAYAMSHLRGRRVDAAVAELIELAAEQVGRSVAEVRVARDLDDEQRARLTAALSKLQGRPVRLNVAVDPAVIGGAVVRIGETVMDGTMASRLEQARRLVAR